MIKIPTPSRCLARYGTRIQIFVVSSFLTNFSSLSFTMYLIYSLSISIAILVVLYTNTENECDQLMLWGNVEVALLFTGLFIRYISVSFLFSSSFLASLDFFWLLTEYGLALMLDTGDPKVTRTCLFASGRFFIFYFCVFVLIYFYFLFDLLLSFICFLVFSFSRIFFSSPFPLFSLFLFSFHYFSLEKTKKKFFYFFIPFLECRKNGFYFY